MIPAALLLAAVQLYDGAWGLWWRPFGLLTLSYLLQWLGHRLEGNDMGEVILLKKLVGRPYVAVAPRFADSSCAATEPRRNAVFVDDAKP
jgi:hypothetical protein